jgi:hypothetical protein
VHPLTQRLSRTSANEPGGHTVRHRIVVFYPKVPFGHVVTHVCVVGSA